MRTVDVRKGPSYIRVVNTKVLSKNGVSTVYGKLYCLLAFVGVLSGPLAALDGRDRSDVGPSVPVVIPRTNGPVRLDGLSDEPAWQGIPSHSYVVLEPNFGAAPTEKTELLMAHDDDFLYVAGRLYDGEPERIQAHSLQRDSIDSSSDWFVVVLDSFNDKENALAFATTPAGLRWDASVSNDAQGDAPLNFSWNAFWDVAVTRNERGWFAEFRIPFSSLRFQNRGGRVVMGVISWRSIARKNEWLIFPKIPPDWGFWTRFKPSRAQEVELRNIQSRKPLYVAPYVLGGSGRTYDLDPAGAAYRRRDALQRELGLDVKYGLTSNLTLDLTVNPDFAQVEADDQQVNLTRFSLFFPEKRLFFQERSGLFNFEFESSEKNCLFYTRRIGIQDGRLVRILDGARLVGRIGDWDLGLLDMETAGYDDVPARNFGVLRFRRQVFNPYSYVGAMATSVVDGSGAYNLAYGLDSVINVFSDYFLTVKWAQTFRDDAGGDLLSLAPARIYLKWMRRSNQGFGYAAAYSRAGAAYDPGVGFDKRENFTRAVASVWQGWRPGPGSSVFSHTLSLDGIFWTSNADGRLESGVLTPAWKVQTKEGLQVIINPVLYYEDVRDAFWLSDKASVPAGRYTFGGLYGTWDSPIGRPLSAALVAEAGSFYDGRRISLKLEPRWNASSLLQLDAALEIDKIAFPARNEDWTAAILRLRALVMLSTKLSVSSFLQYSSASDAVVANLRFRYNPREGADFYLVYNEGLNTDRFRAVPVLPLTNNRALLLKASYTFGL